jgi:hypothetical protein
VPGDQYHAAGTDPSAEQTETLPEKPAGPVAFYGEQTEFSAANDSASGKFSFAGCNRDRHERTGTAERCTFQALKLRFALQFGAFAQT